MMRRRIADDRQWAAPDGCASVRTTRVAGLTAILVTVLAAVAAATGVSLLPLVASAAAPWVLILAMRWGAGLAISAVVILVGLIVLFGMLVLPWTGLPLFPAAFAICLIVAVTGIVLLLRAPPIGFERESASTIAAWFVPLLGPALWGVAMFIRAVSESASRFGWVMLGDSANNVLSARDIVDHGGILFGPSSNPVPLPAAVLALAMTAGRFNTAPSDLLRHDIGALTAAWAIAIAVTCYLAGTAAAAAVGRSRPWTVALAGAGGSLIPLSWFVTGYSLEYGFFNTPLVLPLAFVSWIAALSAKRAPAVAFVSLLGASTLMLAVWSPLVLVPGFLAVTVAWRCFRSLVNTRGWRLGLLLAAILQIGMYGFVVTLPTLFAQGGFLAAGGGVILFPKVLLLSTFAGTGLVVVLAIMRKQSQQAGALAAVLFAGLTGLGALLFVSRAAESPWTYYPIKLAWLMMIILGVLSAGTLIGLIPSAYSVVVGLGTVLVALGTIFALYAAAASTSGHARRDPIPRIINDDFGFNNSSVDRLLTLSDPAHPQLLWRSSDPSEGFVNFWLLQMRAGSTVQNQKLRVLAYGYGDQIQDLCGIATAMGPPITVHTADGSLQSAIDSYCEGDATVVLENSPD